MVAKPLFLSHFNLFLIMYPHPNLLKTKQSHQTLKHPFVCKPLYAPMSLIEEQQRQRRRPRIRNHAPGERQRQSGW